MYRRWMFAPLFLIVVMTTIFGASVASATSISDWNTGSGSIFYAKTLPDGSQVDLVLEDIVKIKESYIVVAEPFRAQDRLVIFTIPDSELRLGQVIECSGTLTTLPTGERALQNVTILGYASGDTGELLYHPNIIKAFPSGEQTTWPWMIDLTVSDAVKTTSAASTVDQSEIPNSDPAERPTYYPKIGNSCVTQSNHSQGVSTQSYYDSIPDLQGLAADSLVELQCKRITAVGTETIGSSTFKYADIAEDLPATDTIRCYYSAGLPTSSNRVNKVTGQIQYTNGGTTEVICVDDGPDYDPQILVGKLDIVNPYTVAFVRTQADGASANLTGVVVTANQTDFPGALYVQEHSGSGSFGGIRVKYTGSTIDRGSLVSVTGPIALATDGEREINADSTGVAFVQQSTVPGPLGMPNKYLGGGDFSIYTPGIDSPTGSGAGLYNKGLLVKSWGRVTAVDTTNKFFYIDDGTGFQDGSGNTGVKVSWDWATSGKADIIPPQVGWYVSVTGISGSETADSGATYYRLLRPREQNDIHIFDPQDTTPPTVTITNPAGADIHLATGQTSARLAGTATDADTGIISVQVGFTATGSETAPTVWCSAGYDADTHVWTYDWQNPQTQRIWVKATDFAMNTEIINRDVSVSTVTVIYVNGDTGNNNNNGSSWSLAKKTVAAALTAAASGTEIWVARRAYYESISLKSGIGLYGGFAPTSTYAETFREQRNWATNNTILDGSRTQTVVNIPYGTVSTVIDGFIIRNGLGHGIYSDNASAKIANNIIRGNASDSIGYSGAGLLALDSTLTVVSNVFINNKASRYGGAIFYSNTSGDLANNTIICNSAESTAGGIYLTSSSPVLSNNIVCFNTGGGIYKSSENLTFTRNIVYGNTTYQYYWTTDPVGTDLPPSDPQIPYIGYGDWHIAEASPCHDPQNTIPAVNMDNDIDCEARLHCSTLDIGADEWNGVDPQLPTSNNVIYVKPAAQGGDDINHKGTSWTDAVATVQKGINISYDWGGGEVWVAAGNYILTSTITLKSGVRLYGGFSGSEASKEQRDWVTNKTILDGNKKYRVVTIGSGASADDTIIDGFTIKGGYSTSTGGGIYCNGSSSLSTSATISHNIITHNYASTEGVGIYCNYSVSIIANNLIIANTGGRDAVYNRYSSGGGIYVRYFTGSIANNTIVGNSAVAGGGGIIFGETTGTIRNNIIAFNSSGLYTSSTPDSNLLIKNLVYGNGSYQYSWTTSCAPRDVAPADPKFVGTAYGDYHILSDSPCRNAGDLDVVPTVLLDIDGDNRSSNDGAIDIGADEWIDIDPNVECRTIRVAPDGSDTDPSHDGSTWALAKKTIQAGINSAFEAGYGEVWVKGATGTGIVYNEAIILQPYVHVLGGFSGNDSERDYQTYISVIDAAGKDSSGVLAGGSTLPIYGGYQLCSVDGFTIKNGNGTYIDSSSGRCGGGVCCQYVAPIVTHNRINLNTTTGYGAGIYCGYCSPFIRFNIIEQNTASGSSSRAAGIYCSTYSAATINNNIIRENSATGSSTLGGGIYTAGPARIANNGIIENTATSGAGVYCSSSSPVISNNTIAYNNLVSGGSGGGIYLQYSPAEVTNCIIASNTGSGIKSVSSPSATLRYNDVWNNALANYEFSPTANDPTGTNGNISIDPLLDTDHLHIGEDANGNDCKNKGLNDAVLHGQTDIDDEYRICNGTVDIGADEISGCIWDTLTFLPEHSSGSLNSEITITVQVKYPLTDQPVSDRLVEFQVTSGGQITSITPEVPNLPGWGQTDANGRITLIVQGVTAGTVTVTATMTNSCDEQVSGSCELKFGYRIGFLYYLCSTVDDAANDFDSNMIYMDGTFDNVIYSKVDNLHDLVYGFYETVFIIMPTRVLNNSEKAALLTFVQMDRNKRIVLVGEYCTNPMFGYSLVDYNVRLNDLAASLDMNSRFDTGTGLYDGGGDYTRLCPLNNSHYLTEGMIGLCDGATKSFVDTGPNDWQLWAQPIAYVYDGYNHSSPSKPCVIEEDTAEAGSRVAIHDSNIILSDYTTYDTEFNKNARFLYNLCTIFAQ